MMRRFVLLAMALLFVASVAACGKKPERVDPPDGGKSGYPHKYPSSK